MSHQFRMSSQRRASRTDSQVLAGGPSTMGECCKMGGPPGRKCSGDIRDSDDLYGRNLPVYKRPSLSYLVMISLRPTSRLWRSC